MTATFFARVSGRVQGIGFRYACLNEALRLGLSGWVRNTEDGDVEVWSEGEADKQDAFLEWLRKGPSRARVDAVDCAAQRPTNAYRDFSNR